MFRRLPALLTISRRSLVGSVVRQTSAPSNQGLLLSDSCVKRMQDICQDDKSQFLRVSVC